MFQAVRKAYERLVKSIEAFASTHEEANDKLRAQLGLDAGPPAVEGDAPRAALPAPGENGRGRKRAVSV